ncbi:MAG TPA: cytochrome c [Longimicrobium sp.]|nr:cytochrome c [Longimicrobium sp.]
MRDPTNTAAALALALAALTLGACERPQQQEGPGIDTARLKTLATPAKHQAGEQAFDARCASCHGDKALGTAQGPPLVHIYYEPNHHGDGSFQVAAARGVAQHHWSFGNMPPVPGTTPEEVSRITEYVRWLQREAGVY